MKINHNFLSLQESYLFAEIDRRVSAFTHAHPDRSVIRMGIGDVTLPLAPAAVHAMEEAARDQGAAERFHGYGPYRGYPFLQEAIQAYYAARGVSLSPDEIFASEGAKSDLGNILDIFSQDNTVLIPDPVYPVYVDTNLMAGRRILYADATPENGFLPMPDPSVQADVLYLCSPNNPTGAVYSRDQLQAWVDYALSRQAVILFDSAYEAFVQDPALPRSIYEIPGARRCAIEFCSLSKTAGFTGTRCGWTILPQELSAEGVSLNRLWFRRQSTKYNGVSYVIQRGAEAALSPEGLAQCRENIAYYRENGAILAKALRDRGVWFTGGIHSPHLWMRCPGGTSSWDFFDTLLERTGVVGTPGEGFGKNGRGFFRLTAFASRESTVQAASLLREFL